MALVKCPDCEKGVSPKAENCPGCGSPIAALYRQIPPEVANCSECKKDYPFQERKCPHCGLINGKKIRFDRPLEEYNEPLSVKPITENKTAKSRSTAILLALFLGGVGIHKFYLNRPGAGIVYLLFFWTCVPLVISFFEAIRYLLMSESTFKEKYSG